MSKNDADGQSWSSVPIVLTTGGHAVKRYLYIKYHNVENREDSNGVSCRVFMCGIPAGVTEEETLQFVSSFGPVQTIAMHSTRTSALIVFETDHGARKMFQAATKGREKKFQRIPRREPCGLKGWVNDHKETYTINTNGVLQKRLDAWMEDFEDREARDKEDALKNMEDDGWTVVRRHKGRKKNVDEASGITVGAVAPAAARTMLETRNAKETRHENFYKFQQREKRRSGTPVCCISSFCPYCVCVLCVCVLFTVPCTESLGYLVGCCCC